MVVWNNLRCIHHCNNYCGANLPTTSWQYDNWLATISNIQTHQLHGRGGLFGDSNAILIIWIKAIINIRESSHTVTPSTILPVNQWNYQNRPFFITYYYSFRQTTPLLIVLLGSHFPHVPCTMTCVTFSREFSDSITLELRAISSRCAHWIAKWSSANLLTCVVDTTQCSCFRSLFSCRLHLYLTRGNKHFNRVTMCSLSYYFKMKKLRISEMRC